MEEVERSQKSDVSLTLARTCPRMSNPQQVSSGQDINQQRFSLLRSFPTTAYSSHLDQGATLQRQSFAFNVEPSTFTSNMRGVEPGDAGLQAALRLLFLKAQPFLCSLLGNLSESEAARLFQGTNFDTSQRITHLDAGTSQEESVQTDVAVEPSSGESAANEAQIQPNERERRFQYLALCVPLYQAALRGDWQAAKDLLQNYPDMVRHPITEEHMTALHVAAAAKHTTFVKELLKVMTRDDLALQNTDGNTALCFAAASGIVVIAEEMVKMNENLPCIRNRQGLAPLLVAGSLGHRGMVLYLFSVTPAEQLTANEYIELLAATISTDMYDVALQILEKARALAIAQDGYWKTALHELAKKPSAIGSKSQLQWWKTCLNSWFNGIYNKALMQTLACQLVESLWKEVRLLPDRQFSNLVGNHSSLLFDAAELGNVEFLIILVRSYPDLMWKLDKHNRSLFHVAVSFRQEKVYNLIYEVGSIKYLISTCVDKYNNNMLHLAGRIAPLDRLNIVSGAALQMQRELLWFKEIEKIVPPQYSKKRNSKGETPKDLFTKTHADLLKAGEKWMKDTANSCMLVATLIATVVFAAVFTVPGGNNQEKGTPIFLESNWFMVFFLSDAMALISSSTSILMFLSILTSRYTENDFLKSLPARLVFGLTSLFISIVGMVVAFSAACFLAYKSKTAWVPTIIIASAGVPIILFVVLHHDLWIDIIRSTYWSGSLFRPPKQRLF